MRKVLFIVKSDPRTSHRPTEAIRIAAGAGAWGKVEVNVCLVAEAARILAHDTGELKDEEQLRVAWPVLEQTGRPIFVVDESDQEGSGTVKRIDWNGLVRLAAQHDTVTAF